jgi:hypothetical protein
LELFLILKGYDAALYTAANTMIQQSGTKWTPPTMPQQHNPMHRAQNKPLPIFKRRIPAQPTQLFYCDACKISCAGPQVCARLIIRLDFPYSMFVVLDLQRTFGRSETQET